MSAAQITVLILVGLMLYSMGSIVNNVGKPRKVIEPSVAVVAVMFMLTEIAGLAYVFSQL